MKLFLSFTIVVLFGMQSAYAERKPIQFDGQYTPGEGPAVYDNQSGQMLTPPPGSDENYVPDYENKVEQDSCEYGRYDEEGYCDENGNYDQYGVYIDQGNQGQQIPMQVDPQVVGQEIYQATNGACDVRKNPHSLACIEWTFDHNTSILPWMPILWEVYPTQGEWLPLTYVNSQGRNRDNNFAMAHCEGNNRQAAGIVNVERETLMGSMWIQGTDVQFVNWLGSRLGNSSRFSQPDQYTLVWENSEPGFKHRFVCHDFARNEKHHLLCRWDLKADRKGWKKKGYMGFLTRADWDGFNCNGAQIVF